METDDFYERQARWTEKQIREGDKHGRLYSLVHVVDEDDHVWASRMLSIKQKELRLEDVNGIYFRVLPENVKGAVWSRRGLWMQLNLEVAGQQHRLRFYSIAAQEITDSYAPKNWFGTLFPALYVNTMRWLTQAQPIAKANFAEAEKWRAVFPNAEFPSTEIKNAKS